MKYCTKCGAELHDEAVVCPRCGCATSDYKAHSSKIDDMTLLIKIFMIIGCVCSGFGLLLPLAWTIPMTVVVCRRLDNHEPIGTGLKVCTLIFCSLIAGILLLCTNTDNYTD